MEGGSEAEAEANPEGYEGEAEGVRVMERVRARGAKERK